MYLPILRGKQYELLALREFSSEDRASEIINPIIEPIKSEFKSLGVAASNLLNSAIGTSIVINPSVGEIKNPEHILRFINETTFKDNPNLSLAVHSYTEEQLAFVLGLITENDLSGNDIIILHNDVVSKHFSDDIATRFSIKYNFINDKIKSRRYKYQFDETTRVLLEDPFITKQKNVDYLQQDDESFSDLLFTYKDEGFTGFSDYLTIGESYSEGGFLPYAVAIHLTYETGDGIRIKHFVSNSNEDYHDTPGKFAEALEKLVAFTSHLHYKTKAVRILEDLYNRSYYPGLGTIKKLSMLNHLELVKYLLTK